MKKRCQPNNKQSFAQQFSEDERAIVALCTPRGSGSLALIRVSGANAVDVVARCARLSNKQRLLDQATHTVAHGHLIAQDDSSIDEVLFIVMHAPKTFTGQNTVEITAHNNPFIIDELIARIIECGARPAERGEFSRRSFLNGKVDLLQAEAINEIIHSQTTFARKNALAQLKGSLSQEIFTIERELVVTLAWCEASFEFLDDEGNFGKQIAERLQKILEKITLIQKNFATNVRIKNGLRVALLGPVNAGKSSLFNRLVGQQRAIVAPIAGTTRDSIEMAVERWDNFITFIDTAGLRSTNDSIEQAGIDRSYAEAEKADIVLVVCDGTRNLHAEEQLVFEKISEIFAHKIIYVHTNSDRPEFVSRNALAVSNVSGMGIANLETHIQEKIAALMPTGDLPFLVNERQHHLLSNCKNQLASTLALLRGEIHYELVSHHLRNAIAELAELTGKTISEKALDAVFKEFCVGK